MDLVDQAQAVEEAQRRNALRRALEAGSVRERASAGYARRINGEPASPAGVGSACLDCGEPIPEARLAAQPNADRCVTCQEDRERGVA